MVVLGIDPGFKYAGFGILKKEGHKTYLLESGFLAMSPSKSLQERIAIFHDFFMQKIITHAITHVAIETPFLGKNAQNFLKLGYLRGILYLLTYKHGLQLYEFSPTQVKQSITGFGGASKEQVARVLLQLFPRLQLPEKADVTDALAISLCGLWQQRNSFLR